MRSLLIPAIVLFLFGISQLESQFLGIDFEKKDEHPVTVKAEKRGFPFVNFENGKELFSTNSIANSSSQAKVLASADFDSDGIADLVNVDSTGRLKLYRGNAEYRSADNKLSKQENRIAPFYPEAKSFSLNISPDYLETGDFNADGKKDILAAAKNDNNFKLLSGDGKGSFTEPLSIPLDGQITSLAIGEIGKQDGQTDAAAVVTNSKGSFLFVFEHPESAFKHKPEIFKLDSPAVSVAIGNLDDDFYADIAVASGNQLTIIHGRGQAYPWDLNKRFGIKRPKAFVAKRQMPFAIAGLEIGDFNDSPGDDLAILANSGSISILEPTRNGKVSNISLNTEAGRQAKGISFAPTGTDANEYGVLGDSQIVSAEAAKESGLPLIDSTLSPKERQEFLTKRAEEETKKLEKLSREELAKRTAEAKAKGEENRRRSKEAFIKTISGRPSTLAGWKLVNLISDARLKNAAYSETSQKLIKARVSDSGKDNLVLLDSISKQIQIVAETKTQDQLPKTEIVSLDAESNPVSVLKMRLNADSLDDLVVLREGSPEPSFLMTAPAATITVNTTSDGASDCQTPGADCTLRGAIQLANASPGADQINFNIPGSAPHKIQPLSELPVITQTLNIFGASQPGFTQNPRIQIDGSLIGQPADGLKIRASSCFVTYLSITGFLSAFDPDTGSKIGGNAISLETPVGFARTRFNSLFHNSLGVAPDGVTDGGNQATGLLLFDSDFNLIENNVMSGNDGAGISVTNGNNNTIRANKIGVNAAGTEKLPNALGIFLTGNNNVIGGDSASSGNTISGNGRQRQPPNEDTCSGIGVYVPPLVSLDTGALLTNGNNILGNKIGTNSAGTAPLGNCSQGITTHPLTTTTIGSITEAGRNIVSDNGYDAIHCGVYDYHNLPEGGFCSIAGNNIGTDITGTVAMANDSRNVLSGLVAPSGVVSIYNNPTLSNVGAPGGTTPGGACTGFCNLISGNAGEVNGAGGAIERYGVGMVVIANNFVGTNKNGTAALPNAANGIYATDSDTLIGGYDAEENVNFGNLVSGNPYAGISVGWWGAFFEADFDIESNLVGTNTTGSAAIPNGPDNTGAVTIAAIDHWTVNLGGSNAFSKNYISGNNTSGVHAAGNGGQIKIINNHIGVGKNNQPLGNTKHGIVLIREGITVGGIGAGEGNVISNNALAGVAVQAGGTVNTVSNSIRGNSIRDNGGLGIDLTHSTFSHSPPDGVTPNDCNDFDDGPNLRQNFPVLSAPTVNQNGTVTVVGSLRSLPSREYTIDFYSNSAADPTEYGEGETFIGALTNVRTNGGGVAAFEFTSSVQVSNTHKITATATDEYGNTSEFSCFAGGCGIGNFQNVDEVEKSLANQEFQCLEPIVVNITSDEQDADNREDVAANGRDLRCDVDRDTPDNQCSLRAAIQEANARSGINLINFDIPGSGFKTIAPATLLPPITDRVIINGTTQPGYTDSPLIEINGANALSNGDGLNFKSGSGGTSPGNGSAVRGLAFTRWLNDVVFDNSNYSEIQNCYIGIKPDGTAGQFEIDNGVVIAGYGVSVSENVISNQDTGIFLNESNAKSCRIERNKIGTDPTGNNKIGNNKGILSIQSSGQHQITENLISGNKGNGIYFLNNSTNETNTISNNLIGTTANGMNALPNTGNGILLENAAKSVITGNTIVGHQATEELIAGIHLISREPNPVGSDGNIIQSNKIGVAQDGATAIPNQYGIIIEGSSKNKIGDAENANLRNIIAGNVKTGIYIKDNLNLISEENEIANNLIGINAGNQSPANQERGVQISGDSPRNKIFKNKISGNSIYGILLFQGAGNTEIFDNQIGDVVPNKIGLRVVQSSQNKIYGNTFSGNEDFNLILGNSIPVFSEQETKPASDVSSLTAEMNVEENEVYRNVIKNSKVGLALTEGARNNRIGHYFLSAEARGNQFAGNKNGVGYGVFIGTTRTEPSDDLLPSGNFIYGNSFGYDLPTSGPPNPIPNKVGLVIYQSKNNVIGEPDSRVNQFLSNEEQAILLSGSKTKGNLIAYNNIGIGLNTSHSDNSFGNGGDGITVVNTGKNSIKYNTIGHTRGNGINVLGLTLQAGEENSLIISGNKIGASDNATNEAGKFGNFNAGIRFSNVQNARIGVDGDAKNIIAGNGSDGILIEGDNSKLNLITNSIIGTSAVGGVNLGNAGNGIYIRGGRENTIGGVPSAGNFISGNDGNGIFIENSRENNVYGNRIGIFSTQNGNVKLPNNQNGIKILNSHNTDIGDGVLTGYRNFIGGNTYSGIVLQGDLTQFNRVKGNFIGTDLNNTNLGNGWYGVFITEQGQKNIVGGTEIEAGNRIANNGTQPTHGGVVIDPLAGSGNNVDPNLIYNNAGLGIDLGSPGHTPNDPADADTGPNNLQNYPEIVSRQIVNNELIIGFKIDSAPGNSNYGTDGIYIEFFKADASGEGEKFLGFSYYTAPDYNNAAPKIKQVNLGNITTLGITANDKITATATDSDGNTSEFMPAVGTIYSISGKVSYRNPVSGEPPKSVAGVLLKATVGSAAPVSTNSNGDYLFDNLENGSYTITPSKTGDINGISPFDATLILRHVAANENGPNALNPIQKIAADANGDGNISPFDATLILRFVAANGPNANTGQVGVWTFAPPSRDYAPLAGTSDNQNYEAILVGEVNGNWMPSSSLVNETATEEQKAKTSDQAIHVSLSDETNTVTKGGAVIVPLIISNKTRKVISGLSFDITYDPAVLQPDMEQPVQTTDKSDGFMLVADTTASGRIGIAGSTAGSLIAPEGTFLMLRFKVIGESGYASNAAKMMLSQQLSFTDENGNSITTTKKAFR